MCRAPQSALPARKRPYPQTESLAQPCTAWLALPLLPQSLLGQRQPEPDAREGGKDRFYSDSVAARERGFSLGRSSVSNMRKSGVYCSGEAGWGDGGPAVSIYQKPQICMLPEGELYINYTSTKLFGKQCMD